MATRKISRKEALRRRKQRQRRKKILTAAIVLAVVAIALILVLALRKPADSKIEIEMTSQPTVEVTAAPTPEPTPTLTPEPTPEPTPEVYIPVNLYAPDGDNVRHKLTEYVSNWKRGKDIDCFEVLVSDSDKLTGKNFLAIAKETWGTLPDPYAMRIGYTLRYTLADGSEVSMQILSPKDITHTEYVECYLYDDVHSKGFYTHLSESGMKEDTLITSIKITCGDKIDQVQEMWLGAFLYDSQDQFDANGKYTGAWRSEINIRRKG